MTELIERPYNNDMVYITTFLNSFSQVFLIENPFFGFLIIFGMLIAQPRLASLSSLGVISGVIFAKLVGTENTLIQAGIMGFNASLVGIACGVLIQKNEIAITVTVIGSILALLVQFIAMKYEISIFTLPFVIIAVIIFFLKPIFHF